MYLNLKSYRVYKSAKSSDDRGTYLDRGCVGDLYFLLVILELSGRCGCNIPRPRGRAQHRTTDGLTCSKAAQERGVKATTQSHTLDMAFLSLRCTIFHLSGLSCPYII